MRVLYVCQDIAIPGGHGGSTHASEFALALKELGHEVHVLIRKRDSDLDFDVINGVNYYRVKIGNAFINFLRFFFKSLKLIHSKDIDLVIERDRLFGGPGMLAAYLLRKKRILEVNDPVVETHLLSGKIRKGLKYYSLKTWHDFMSRIPQRALGTHNCMIKEFGKRGGIVTWAANPKTFKEVKYAKKKLKLLGKKVILYMGSMTEWHSFDEMLDAIKLVFEKESKALFYVIGSSWRRDKFKKLLKDKGILDRTILSGSVDHDKLPLYISASDVCLALYDPNYKPFKVLSYFYSPIKVWEYMSCSRPVIATNIGNLKKMVINGKGGFLVENNPKDINDKILKILKNKKLADKMGVFNRKLIEQKYNWRQVALNFLRSIK